LWADALRGSSLLSVNKSYDMSDFARGQYIRMVSPTVAVGLGEPARQLLTQERIGSQHPPGAT
jgi:hypothetical protein